VKVRFTPSARERFLDVIQRIRDDNPLAASRFRVRVEKALRRLGPYPHSGRKIPEFPELPHREVVVAQYRFFYRVDGKLVWIVCVWHGAQLPAAPREGGV
jgi:plasmid stabilization system protein ParE